MEFDSVADLCVAIPGKDEVCYVLDDEMRLAPPQLTCRFKSIDSLEHEDRSAASMECAEATIAVVDRADTAMRVTKSLLYVPSYDVSGLLIHGWSREGENAPATDHPIQATPLVAVS